MDLQVVGLEDRSEPGHDPDEEGRSENRECVRSHSGRNGSRVTVRPDGEGHEQRREQRNRENENLKRAVNAELDGRNGVVDHEITELAPEHSLVKVTETTEDGDSRVVLCRIQHEPKPDGTDEIHWEYPGPTADEGSE